MLLIRRLPRRPSGERGSALMGVIALMGVTGVVALVVGSVSVNALVITKVTQTGVQSQAAAEAGIDTTLASLRASGCSAGTLYQSTTSAPYYKAEVSVSTGTAAASFHAGCPTATGYVRIVSTGSDSAAGLTDPSANPRRVEGIYHYTVAAGAITGSGAALYTYSSTGFGGAGQLAAVNGSKPSVQIRQGSVVCSGASNAEADVVVANGTFEGNGSCKITGNVWSSGTMKLSGASQITGNAVSSGLTFEGGLVKGSAWSTGGMALQWGSQINGKATAATLTLSGGKVGGDAWASGTANFPAYASTIGGHLTARSVTGAGVAGTGKTVVPAGPGPGPAPIAAPVVPDWVDFRYLKADWPGFGETVVSGACGYDVLQAAANGLASSPGIIDARLCTGAITISSYQKLALSNDLVIVANSFDLAGSSGFTSTTDRKLWLVTPDVLDNDEPTCPAGGRFTVGGAFTVDNKISAMIFSPCRVSIGSGITWRGQVFAGTAVIDGAAVLNYIPLGLPLVDLTTGNPTSGSGASTIGEPYSVRDYAGG